MRIIGSTALSDAACRLKPERREPPRGALQLHRLDPVHTFCLYMSLSVNQSFLLPACGHCVRLTSFICCIPVTVDG